VKEVGQTGRLWLALPALVLTSWTGGGAPGSAVTPGFDPLSFTAVSESDYWVLGQVPCPARGCFSILQTTDGGRRFVRKAAPSLPTHGSTPTLRFADRRDGFAFVPWSPRAFYATHDGGATWHRLRLRTVLTFATGGGYAYLVTARCSPRRGCSAYRLERSPVSADRWSALGLPFITARDSIFDLAAQGTNLWLLGTARDAPAGRDELARSVDAGLTWVARRAPCIPGLGGDVAPATPRVLWAVCPTGLEARAWRSTDDGASFELLPTPVLPNSAVLAPASSETAVLARSGGGPLLLRTTDGGARWHPVRTPPAGVSAWVGFTDARVGAALVETRSGRNQLWRTTDGGAAWVRVALR
jgi:photosystem II stability/assembly factor-like uncharacterized protein